MSKTKIASVRLTPEDEKRIKKDFGSVHYFVKWMLGWLYNEK